MRLYDFNPSSTKPLVILAHANGFPPQTYQRAVQPLLEDFHVVSLLARPFWGDTPSGWLRDWSQLADDLIAGIEDLKAGTKGTFEKITGIGHSLGGVLTLYAAVKRPDLFSKVVLIDPTMLSPRLLFQIRFLKMFGLDARKHLIRGALKRKRNWGSAAEAFDHFRGRGLFQHWTDDQVEAYVKNMTGPAPSGGVQLIYPPEWEARIYQTIPTDVWKFAKRIEGPTLVVRGEDSNTFTAAGERAFRKANPKVVFEVVSGAGHLVPQEKPAEIGNLLKNFL